MPTKKTKTNLEYISSIYDKGGRAGYSKAFNQEIETVFARYGRGLESDEAQFVEGSMRDIARKMAQTYNKRMERMEKSGLASVNSVYYRARLDRGQDKPRVSLPELSRMSMKELESTMRNMDSILSNIGSKVGAFKRARRNIAKMANEIGMDESKSSRDMLEDMFQTDMWKSLRAANIIPSEGLVDYITEVSEANGITPIQALSSFVNEANTQQDYFDIFSGKKVLRFK